MEKECNCPACLKTSMKEGEAYKCLITGAIFGLSSVITNKGIDNTNLIKSSMNAINGNFANLKDSFNK